MTQIFFDILKGLSDKYPISNSIKNSQAVKNLYLNYNYYRKNFDASLPKIKEDSLGDEFKLALSYLPSDVALTFLSQYKEELGDFKYSSQEEGFDSGEEDVYDGQGVKSETKIENIWLSAIIAIFLVSVLTIVVSVVYVVIDTGELPDDGIIKAILHSVLELIKVILGI